MLPAQREAPAKGAYSTAAERAFTGGAAGLGQFVRFAGPLALVWAGRSFVRTRGGCSYRVGVTRSVVGAPPRCEAKSNQYTEPAHSHPGRVLLPDGGTRSIVGAPPRCEAKSNQYTEPVPFAPGAGAPTGWGWRVRL